MKTGVINCKAFFTAGMRIDPDVHLSEGSVVRNELNHLPYQLSTVGENAADVFYGNIFSRIFVQDPEHGMPYLAASDTVLANLDTGRFLSKKQASQLRYLILKKDWILVTCSGTLGNVTYTNKTFENHIATHDLIRIIPNSNKVNKGTLYAFLASKFGYYQITQSQFGGVVKHINTDQTKSIIVPVFPADFQQEVDDMIQDSARLREQATDALNEAHKKVETFVGLEDFTVPAHVSIQSILKSHNNRFEGSYFISDNRRVYNFITTKFQYKLLRDYTEDIFRPGIFKREYVNKGVTFLGGSNIMMAIPSSDKQLSLRQVARMPELRIKKGWMLVTCGGTIGNTVYVDGQLAQCAISQHVMRIVPKSDKFSGFLYGYLSSEIGKKLITMFTYGSVIPSLEPHHLELVPIPDFDSTTIDEVDTLVKKYVEKNEKAKELELAAIAKVEQEIEKWNN